MTGGEASVHCESVLEDEATETVLPEKLCAVDEEA